MRAALAIGGGLAESGVAGVAGLAQAAAERQADLLALPALSFGVPGGILCDAPLFDDLRGIAERCRIALVFGYLEACETGLFSAAQLVIDDGRAVANYRCTHAGTGQGEALAHGHWLTIAPVDGRRIGFLIGDDIGAPEVARSLVLAGADTLLHMASDVPLNDGLARVRAWENRCPLLSVSNDAAIALGPSGDHLPGEPGIAGLTLADLPPADPMAASGRRPELYGQIAMAHEDR